jgi:hypothetical protein
MVLGAETVSGAVVVSLSGLRSALPLVLLSVFPLASLMVSPKVLRLVSLKVPPWALRSAMAWAWELPRLHRRSPSTPAV